MSVAELHYLGKADLSAFDALPGGGAGWVGLRRERLHARLVELGLGPAARLLAVPVLRQDPGAPAASEGTRAPREVSWYGPFEGAPIPLASLPPGPRARVLQRLRQSLELLAGASADAAIAVDVRAALNVPDLGSVLAVGDDPVLVNWGLVPRGTPTDAASVEAHFERTLGQLGAGPARVPPPVLAGAPGELDHAANLRRSPLAATTAMPVATAGVGPAGAASTPEAVSARPLGTRQAADESRFATPPATPSEVTAQWLPAGAGNAPGVPGTPPSGTRRGALPVAPTSLSGWPTTPSADVRIYPAATAVPWYCRAWLWALGALLILASGWLGSALARSAVQRFRAPRAGASEMPGLLEMQRATNESLARRIAVLQQALRGGVCTATVPPEVAAAAGLDAGPAAAPSPSPSPSPSPGAAPAPSPSPGVAATSGTALNRPELVQLLEQATVLVVTNSGTGSGFFVNPETVVTNAHVVEGADRSAIQIASETLGRGVPVQLVDFTQRGPQGGRDYAILRAPAGTGRATLALGTAARKLDHVSAAGYPGVYLELWQQLGGRSIPPLILRAGEVTFVKDFGDSVPRLAHSAEVLPGNSGGPLVDDCGRVLGVNTFLYHSEPTGERGVPATSVSFALGSADLARYLEQQRVSFARQDDSCR